MLSPVATASASPRHLSMTDGNEGAQKDGRESFADRLFADRAGVIQQFLHMAAVAAYQQGEAVISVRAVGADYADQETFSDQLPGVAVRRARRTLSVSRLLQLFAHGTEGLAKRAAEAASRHADER
jgi:hypothetical protein